MKKPNVPPAPARGVRNRPHITITLGPDVAAEIERLVETTGVSRSRAIDRMLRKAFALRTERAA